MLCKLIDLCNIAYSVYNISYLIVSVFFKKRRNIWLSIAVIFTERRTYYSDTIMNANVSQNRGISIVYSTVCSGADQRTHQSFASLVLARGIHRWAIDYSHKAPVTRKMIYLMTSSWWMTFNKWIKYVHILVKYKMDIIAYISVIRSIKSAICRYISCHTWWYSWVAHCCQLNHMIT